MIAFPMLATFNNIFLTDSLIKVVHLSFVFVISVKKRHPENV